MKLTCNIDRRGRRARLISGMIVDTCAAAFIVVGVLMESTVLLVLGIFLCVTGSFMIFEAASGWCALRALGVKTPL